MCALKHKETADPGPASDKMAGCPSAFHRKHGQNIRLLEDATVAHRVDGYNEAMVFTERPVPIGGMFQVKLLDTGGDWTGSIVSGGYSN